MNTFEEITDRKLLTMWQRQISQTKEKKLDKFKLCGQGILPIKDPEHKKTLTTDIVSIISNGKNSRILGNLTCHSSWACPVCTPINMSKLGTDIACAIEALKKQGQLACMITFTLPHTKSMSAKDSLEIFKQTWRRFSRTKKTYKSSRKYKLKLTDGEKNTRGGNAVKNAKAGDIRIHKKGKNPYGIFMTELNINHFIMVYEFSWGLNSWHPHIHALFWIPKNQFQDALKYKNMLINEWWHCAKFTAQKYFLSTFKDKQKAIEFVDKLYADSKKRLDKDGHKSVYFSTDKNGKLIEQKSSMYVTGWKSEQELSGLQYKSGHKEHLTPHQILENAFRNDHNEEARDFWINLYNEYAIATSGKKRFTWSIKSGIKQIIADYKNTNEYWESIRKKLLGKDAAQKPWKVIVWFCAEQWLDVCILNNTYGNHFILAEILARARLPNGAEQIKSFLENYGLTCNDTTYKSPFINIADYERRANKTHDKYFAQC